MVDSYLAGVVQHSPMSTVEEEKAWHLLAILLSIGRPASPEELASKCNLFSASQDLVRYLCLIPNSPLYLLDNGLVMVSMVAISAMGDLVSRAMVGWDLLGGRIRVLEGYRFWNSDVRTYCRKRKRLVLDAVDSLATKRSLPSPSKDGSFSHLQKRISHISAEEPADKLNEMVTNMSLPNVDLCVSEVEYSNMNKERAEIPFLLDHTGSSSFLLTNVGTRGAENEVQTNMIMNKDIPGSEYTPKQCEPFLKVETDSNILKSAQADKVMLCNLDLNLVPPSNIADLYEEVLVSDIRFGKKAWCSAALSLEVDKPHNCPQLETGICHNHPSQNSPRKPEDVKTEEVNGEEDLISDIKANMGHLVQSDWLTIVDETQRHWLEPNSPVNISLNKDKKIGDDILTPSELAKLSSNKNPAMSCGKLNSVEPSDFDKVVNPKQLDQRKSAQKLILKGQRLKISQNQNIQARYKLDAASISPKSQLENQALPQFEAFIIEEEEGSGGYGTVYRARRRSDGKRFAIKCPHNKVHRQNVTNELKMLERFGGRSSIIKYEGSLNNGSSDCLILAHFEHDRPEVLKKEIGIHQLQQYAYCMFRALAYLHNQGVMHRDIKPGNFLFSRKLNRGYLIDFNLSMDLRQKFSLASRSDASQCVPFDHIPLPHSRSALSTKDKKFVRSNFSVAKLGDALNTKKSEEQDKQMKKRALAGHLKNHPDTSGVNMRRSQGADGSGVTSTKDVRSCRTPRERKREPIPCQGRKELISLVEDAMQNPHNVVMKNPASKRKRVAAIPGIADGEFFYPSPMPLHCTGVSLAGAGFLKSKGNTKLKKEGSCVGTKGFRAPEVLVRSLHQGPKVDVWSAGVTLLYLMIGKIPFAGDPEQNIRDIATLRGSEDLWEVAKLHDRESSFPVELLNIQYLSAIDLQSWCKIHTKRPEFFKLIPQSLFDLVDKCLTVNPRVRISAEEALRHEFFAPVYESLRKQKILKRGLGLDSCSVERDTVNGQGEVSLEL